jgi:hypothetical protein
MGAKKRMPLEIFRLPADDVEAAVAYYRRRKAEGRWSDAEAEMLLLKQGDPAELRARLEELEEED